MSARPNGTALIVKKKFLSGHNTFLVCVIINNNYGYGSL